MRAAIKIKCELSDFLDKERDKRKARLNRHKEKFQGESSSWAVAAKKNH